MSSASTAVATGKRHTPIDQFLRHLASTPPYDVKRDPHTGIFLRYATQQQLNQALPRDSNGELIGVHTLVINAVQVNLEETQWPPDLHTIEFGEIWHRGRRVPPGRSLHELWYETFPEGVRTIKFDAMNSPIHRIKWPSTLETIELMGPFNQPMFEVKWPASLTTMVLGPNYSHGIGAMGLPPNLKRLAIGHTFNHSLDYEQLPDSLECLEFGDDAPRMYRPGEGFNQSIRFARLPASLRTLVLGDDFDQDLVGVRWPTGLEELSLGNQFNQYINRSCLPPNLTFLDLGSRFHQRLDDVVWPDSLRTLVLPRLLRAQARACNWFTRIEVVFQGGISVDED
jgi:hypothetical protein